MPAPLVRKIRQPKTVQASPEEAVTPVQTVAPSPEPAPVTVQETPAPPRESMLPKSTKPLEHLGEEIIRADYSIIKGRNIRLYSREFK